MSTNDLPCIGCSTQDGCGTGTGNWPKPGDPDNNSILKATAVFGGVDVTWSFPLINPHAVQHTLLFRATQPNFEGAALLAVVAGSHYFDKDFIQLNLEDQYFYWIQIVSVNGTYGEVIGPALASPRPLIGQMIELLTGKIDAGVLAQSLKQDIDRIGSLKTSLDNEVIDRTRSNQALADALALVRRDTEQAVAYVNSTIDAVLDGHSLLITQLDTLSVGNRDNAAAIIEETTARVTEDSALSRRIDTLYAESGNNSAAIRDEAQARTSADEALAVAIQTAQSELNGKINSNDLKQTEALSTAQSQLSSQITTVDSRVSVLATNLSTAQSILNDQIASVQTSLTTNINAVGNTVESIGALYTAKVSVNGLVGGFGVFNDGTEIEAGFDVDRFWIGRAGTKRKPFIVQNGMVYIDEAAINTLTFDKLRAQDGSFIVSNGKIKADYLEVGNIQSDNYVANSAGWKLSRNGTFELNSTVSGQGRIQITNQLIRIWDSNNVLRIRMGIW